MEQKEPRFTLLCQLSIDNKRCKGGRSSIIMNKRISIVDYDEPDITTSLKVGLE